MRVRACVYIYVRACVRACVRGNWEHFDFTEPSYKLDECVDIYPKQAGTVNHGPKEATTGSNRNV